MVNVMCHVGKVDRDDRAADDSGEIDLSDKNNKESNESAGVPVRNYSSIDNSTHVTQDIVVPNDVEPSNEIAVDIIEDRMDLFSKRD